jgi:hypothetical protein
MTVFLVLLATHTAVAAFCYLGRGWILEFAQQCVERDIATARKIREQADEMLFSAELAAISVRALTTETCEMPTVKVRVGRGWAGLKEWSQATFGGDQHEGWEGEHAQELAIVSEAVRSKQSNSRTKWPLRQRVTPLVMPQHLPPDPERALRVHTLARTAS